MKFFIRINIKPRLIRIGKTIISNNFECLLVEPENTLTLTCFILIVSKKTKNSKANTKISIANRSTWFFNRDTIVSKILIRDINYHQIQGYAKYSCILVSPNFVQFLDVC
jgi:hypothetical protein